MEEELSKLKARYDALLHAAARMAVLLKRADEAHQPLAKVLDGEQWGALAGWEQFKHQHETPDRMSVVEKVYEN
jgi:hypothetical protein